MKMAVTKKNIVHLEDILTVKYLRMMTKNLNVTMEVVFSETSYVMEGMTAAMAVTNWKEQFVICVSLSLTLKKVEFILVLLVSSFFSWV